MTDNLFDFSTSLLTLKFSVQGTRLRLAGLGSSTQDWAGQHSHAPLFAVDVDGQTIDSGSLDFTGLTLDDSEPGLHKLVLSFSGSGLRVDQHLWLYTETAVVETWPVITNTGAKARRIERMDAFSFVLPAQGDRDAAYQLLSFRGDWGSEFAPQELPLLSAVRLESRSGRSSKGDHPWLAVTHPGGQVFSAAVAWSGNWVMRFDPLAEGGCRFAGGINDWEFQKDLAPGESIESPHLILVFGANLNHISRQYARVGRAHWYPRNQQTERLPVEWNHWWPYEDVEINQDVFIRNLETAAQMGMEVCTLDAGWFGPSDPNSEWYQYRGDWHMVNSRRFPDGIRALANRTHALGMKFGIWCEIEGLGASARLAEEHPDFVALRDQHRLGYVCFGNPAVQEWAFETLTRLIDAYDADWIKLDFNLDPGAGCNRTDHGHGVGDGLYAHYQGYYQTLARVRAAYPEVILENCSSGGLRIDLGMLQNVHCTFLSDPDWPVHDLQIFWGASTMLAPSVLLHWSFSDWRNTNPPPQQNFDPHDPNLQSHQLDMYTRISMLGMFGFSQKLPDLPAWVAARLVTHTQIYQKHVRRFVRQADLYRLTGQPQRSGAGERWCAFQYSLPDSQEHLLFVFRLPGAEVHRSIRMEDLDAEAVYVVGGFETEPERQFTGQELMETGLLFEDLPEEGSALLRVSRR